MTRLRRRLRRRPRDDRRGRVRTWPETCGRGDRVSESIVQARARVVGRQRAVSGDVVDQGGEVDTGSGDVVELRPAWASMRRRGSWGCASRNSCCQRSTAGVGSVRAVVVSVAAVRVGRARSSAPAGPMGPTGETRPISVGRAFADVVEGGDGGVVGVGEGVEVLLGGGDAGMSHPFLHHLDVGAAGEEPGGVGVA